MEIALKNKAMRDRSKSRLKAQNEMNYPCGSSAIKKKLFAHDIQSSEHNE